MSADSFSPACPLPLEGHRTIQLSHGGGGEMTQRLLNRIFLPAFDNPALRAAHDGAALSMPEGRLAFSTDSYVVRPLFFPGGDIGTLAVNGTINDLAMCGARPLYLSAGFILEEGLPIETLERIVASMGACATAAGVQIVTGDTKVVDRGKGDGIYITTAGVGTIPPGIEVSPSAIEPDDRILLSGDVGRHGIAIMASREGLELETPVESDCAPVHRVVEALIEAGCVLHGLRDLTRGGLATALIELAETRGLGMTIEEEAIPVLEPVRGACELLGLDPLFVANEGRFVAMVSPGTADRALDILREHARGAPPAQIGRVEREPVRGLQLRTALGPTRRLHRLSGEQLPRIC